MASKSIKAVIMIFMLVCISFAPSQGKANVGYADLKPNVLVYSQPPSPSGGLFPSSWWDPDGSSSDRYVWDNFTLTSPQGITEIDWVGGYDPAYSGSGGPVVDFTVAIYPSTAAGTQPDIFNLLVGYQTGGNAGETPAGSLGGIAMYAYSFVLPAPFVAQAGAKYWVQIYAWQHGSPDWGITKGTSGDAIHFLRIHGIADTYFLVAGDAAFTLLGSSYKQVWLPLITR